MKRGSGPLALGVYAITALTLIGCGEGLSRFSARQRMEAPQSQMDAGLIVRGASESQLSEFLDQHPQVQFRVLNSAHQMYELFGVNGAAVKSELPQASVSRNQFFTYEKAVSAAAKIRTLADGAGPGGLEKCVKSEKEPSAVITAETLERELGKKLLPRAKTLRLDSGKSTNTEGATKPLRMAWIVMRPKGSKLPEEQVIASPTVEVETDAMGSYGVGLIVQDENNTCNLDIVEFAVTDNRDYVGPTSGTNPLAAMDLTPMRHLASVHARESWDISQGKGQIIAVVDTGVNFNHPALRDNILVNPKEIPANGLDDDHNGFVDDVVGWDFDNSDNSPYDDVGHGSHVAGLAASSIMGMAKQAQILPVKALGSFGGDTGSVAAAIRYAVDRGARIVNLSLGSYAGPNPEIVAAMDYAEAKGALIVAAAGNGDPQTGIGVDTDEMPNYPSSLTNPNILAVAALSDADQITTYSNYGAKSVDVAAPGGDEKKMLLSTYLENPAQILFEGMAGTSMAAPVVAGIAAQVWAKEPSLSALQVKAVLMSSGPAVAGLEKATVSGHKVDALAAVSANAIEPEMVGIQ